PVDEEVVAEVDVGLERGELVRTDLGEREHRLQAVAGAVLKRGETQLARVTQVHDPARHADDLVRLLACREVPEALPDLTDRARQRQDHGIGVDAGVEEAPALVRADLHLLGDARVVAVLGRVGLGGAGLLGPPSSLTMPHTSPATVILDSSCDDSWREAADR